MRKYFEKVSTKGEAPQIASFGNMMTFYSLLFFLIAIPFILIIALVWLTGVIGFSTWIIAGTVVLGGFVCWRLYRQWGKLKAKLAAQGADVKDMVREATQSGQDVEVSLLNGLLTFRYHGNQYPGPPLALPATTAPLALEAPGESGEYAPVDPGKLLQELEGFIRLRDAGAISPEEFDAIKSRLLGSIVEEPPFKSMANG